MNLIVAVDKNWAIGKEDKLLVSIPADMKMFRQETTGKVVILGRKTLATFPGGLPLKNRTNIILTGNRDFRAKDAVIVHSIEELLEAQQIKVAAELEQLRRIQTVINTKLSLLHRARDLQDVTDLSPVFLESQEEDQLLILSAPIFSDDHDRIFSALCEHIAQCSHYRLNSGYPYGAMLPLSGLRAQDWETYGYFFTETCQSPEKIPSSIKTCIKKAGTYAAIYLRGNYYKSEEAFRKLLAYLDKHRLAPGEFVYKEAVLDELSAKEEEYLTRISVNCK